MNVVVTAVLAWGALAFGAVYQWAYVPMGVVVLACAAWAVFSRRPPVALGTGRLAVAPTKPEGRSRSEGGPAPTYAAVALVLAAIAVQLVPIGVDTLAGVSPGADRILREVDVAYANGISTTHALSIDPWATARALGFLVLVLVWAWTCAAILNGRASALRTFARHLAILGTLVAVVGLAQKATFNGKLLWFWEPTFFATNGFGPFVNRNHFAGWMLLALAVTVGLLLGRMSRVAFHPRATWRDKVLWLGSPAATPVLLTAAAALVMAVALVWTMSRSGIAAMGVALTLLLVAGLRRTGSGLRRGIVAASVLTILLGVASWRGTDTLADWYGNTGTLQWRLQLWEDSLPVLGDFWVTGSGLNTYSTLMLVEPRTDLRHHPNAAHNDYLQLAIEGGLLVGIPVLLFVAALARAIVRSLRAPQDEMTWWIRMGATAGLCGLAVQEISEFSLQIPGVALLAATCVAIAVHPPAQAQSRRLPRSASEPEAPDASAVAA